MTKCHNVFFGIRFEFMCFVVSFICKGQRNIELIINEKKR